MRKILAQSPYESPRFPFFLARFLVHITTSHLHIYFFCLSFFLFNSSLQKLSFAALSFSSFSSFLLNPLLLFFNFNCHFSSFRPSILRLQGMLSLAKSKSSSVSSRVDMNNNNNNPGELEIRPGRMFVQMRNSESSNRSSVSVPTIRVRVKFGSTYHEVLISPQASFGELKKMLSERTGLHPEEQKLIYKKKERDSKGYLDVARVRDGSKIVLVEDIINRERRCLEMLKIAKFQKDSNSIAQICSQVDKFSQQVTDLEAIASRGVELTDEHLDNLIGNLMTELVKLDEIVVDGDLKLQKRKQEKRVQSYIETLDMLRLRNTQLSSKSGKVPLQKQEHSYGKVTVPLQKQAKQRNLTELKHPFRDSDSFVVTTKWETFD